MQEGRIIGEISMQNRIRVSVVMPCYNAEKYIAEAIKSILNQTYPYFRLIIVDDGSTDKSRKIIEKYVQQDSRVHLLCNIQNQGQVYTRNRGMTECDTEYIALMDADDVALPYRFEREIMFLDSHPEIGAVGSNYQLINEYGKVIGRSKIRAFDERSVKANLFFQNVLANSSMMFRAEIVKKNNIRYRDEDKGSIEDYRFWSEFSNYAQIANFPCVLVQYRIVGNSISHISRSRGIVKRNQTFDDIHREMFEKSGFALGEDGSAFIQMFRDQFCCKSVKEWKVAYRCLKRINRQATEMNVSYKQEMKKVSIYNMLRFTKSLLWYKVRFFCVKGKNQ